MNTNEYNWQIKLDKNKISSQKMEIKKIENNKPWKAAGSIENKKFVRMKWIEKKKKKIKKIKKKIKICLKSNLRNWNQKLNPTPSGKKRRWFHKEKWLQKDVSPMDQIVDSFDNACEKLKPICVMTSSFPTPFPIRSFWNKFCFFNMKIKVFLVFNMIDR
jgi:hypothetical protein